MWNHCPGAHLGLATDPLWVSLFSSVEWGQGRQEDELASLQAQTVKSPPVKAGDWGSIPGWGRSPGQANGQALRYSCLGNPRNRGAWTAIIVHGVATSQTHFHLQQWQAPCTRRLCHLRPTLGRGWLSASHTHPVSFPSTIK